MRGGWLTTLGVILAVIGYLLRSYVQNAALQLIRRQGLGIFFDREDSNLSAHLSSLNSLGAIANVLLFGGAVVVLIGLVMMVIQAIQSSADKRAATDNPSFMRPDRAISLEDENRRLREELARRQSPSAELPPQIEIDRG